MLWVVAVFVTVGLAVFQRVTGPTYPVSGQAVFGGREIPFRLERTHAGATDAPVAILLTDTTIHASVEWTRYESGDPWARVQMVRSGDSLVAFLPHQPVAGRLQYRVILSTGSVDGFIPSTDGVVLRFRDEVPPLILWLHIVSMFFGLLFSARAGLEVLAAKPSIRSFALAAICFLAVGGVILGPLVQKYAFDAYWTGWPIGSDLTDNKTAVALLGWIAAAIALRRSKHPHRWVLTASIITFLVFVIPHSLLGSALKYTEKGQISTGTQR